MTALNAGYGYLEVRCLGCETHQTVALDVVRRPKTTPIHELERYMCCEDGSQLGAFLTSAVTWLRCGRKISATIRRRRGGRGKDDRDDRLAARSAMVALKIRPSHPFGSAISSFM